MLPCAVPSNFGRKQSQGASALRLECRTEILAAARVKKTDFFSVESGDGWRDCKTETGPAGPLWLPKSQRNPDTSGARAHQNEIGAGKGPVGAFVT